jgi:hypothetical protein
MSIVTTFAVSVRAQVCACAVPVDTVAAIAAPANTLYQANRRIRASLPRIEVSVNLLIEPSVCCMYADRTSRFASFLILETSRFPRLDALIRQRASQLWDELP